MQPQVAERKYSSPSHDAHQPSRAAGPFRLVGLSGNLTRPSKTRALVDTVIERLQNRYAIAGEVLDLADMLPDLGTTYDRRGLHGHLADCVQTVETADLLVVGTPVYKGSMTGMLKHLFDLLDPLALRAMPVVVSATGGGERHALVVEHQLRPLLGFFMAHVMPVAIYASERDFDGGRLVAEPILRRIDDCLDDCRPWIFAGRSGSAGRVNPDA